MKIDEDIVAYEIEVVRDMLVRYINNNCAEHLEVILKIFPSQHEMIKEMKSEMDIREIDNERIKSYEF
jgi:hypothetical protein